MKSDNLRSIEEYPDISFIENYSIEQLEEDMITWFRNKRKELTGEDIILAKADDRRILLQTGAYFIFQGYMFSDDAAKMGLLKYSRGEYLENVGALKHIYRKEALNATTTIRFSIKEDRKTVIGIPKGTRVTAGDGVYFATDEYSELDIGKTYVDVSATCTYKGRNGNDYEIGDIKTIVDPIPYIDSAENITRPENGADREDDEALRERIFIAPSAYSTAGTEDAYEYFIREFNPDVSDVTVTSPEPCVVRIRYLLKDGEIPGDESIHALSDYLTQPDIKPLTDKIEVMAPKTKHYDLNISYFINESDRNRAEVIQKDVQEAIKAYKVWQRSKMGRDINPYELTKRIMAAGAKRVNILAPQFAVINDDSVAALNTETVSYGGLEDD